MLAASNPLRAARTFHLVTAVVTGAALLLQAILIVRNADATVSNFVSYFTVQSNLLVLISAASLAQRPDRDGPVWRVVRLDALICITVTGVVYNTVLRELSDLHGWDSVANNGLHVIAPVLAVLGWVLYGPRPRLDRSVLLRSLTYPLLWIVYTLIRGEIADWYPYPFVDVATHGYGRVAVNLVGVAIVFSLVGAVFLALDDRLRCGVRTEAAPAA